METNDIMIPLPSSSRDVQIRSFSDKKKIYTVNVAKMTCTCPDFVERRATHPHGSIRRTCKHLRKQLLEDKTLSDSMVGSILKEDYVPRHLLHDESIPAIIGFTTGKEWINIFTSGKGNKFDKFGYSLLEERWSYQTPPPAEEQILSFIHKHFDVGEKFNAANPVDKSVTFTIRTEDLEKFYDLCNSILEDDTVDRREVVSIMEYFTAHPTILLFPEFGNLVNFFEAALADSKFDQGELNKLKGLLRIISTTIK